MTIIVLKLKMFGKKNMGSLATPPVFSVIFSVLCRLVIIICNCKLNLYFQYFILSFMSHYIH